jgi:hypothetical protein
MKGFNARPYKIQRSLAFVDFRLVCVLPDRESKWGNPTRLFYTEYEYGKIFDKYGYYDFSTAKVFKIVAEFLELDSFLG